MKGGVRGKHVWMDERTQEKVWVSRTELELVYHFSRYEREEDLNKKVVLTVASPVLMFTC